MDSVTAGTPVRHSLSVKNAETGAPEVMMPPMRGSSAAQRNAMCPLKLSATATVLLTSHRSRTLSRTAGSIRQLSGVYWAPCSPTPGISVTTPAMPSRHACSRIGAHCSLMVTMPPMTSSSGRRPPGDRPTVQHRTRPPGWSTSIRSIAGRFGPAGSAERQRSNASRHAACAAARSGPSMNGKRAMLKYRHASRGRSCASSARAAADHSRTQSASVVTRASSGSYRAAGMPCARAWTTTNCRSSSTSFTASTPPARP
ncbi:hypothetical protein OHA72_26265 [Dactylosporangium sp. NBC_01737]|uniref:hypothetical protein n=1 Tax=Dactylosporangium sp. NBC_01737 TaxID=2975959 RepID=UPI002E0E3A54|nr:hypothetical protein OHA72_26265 [Dactylosporangium sp. NBC_01737]